MTGSRLDGRKLPYDPAIGVQFLSEADPRLGILMQVVGPFAIHYRPTQDLFEALCQAIVHQQLSGKAAGTIYRRFTDLLGPNGSVRPGAVLKLDPEILRTAGLSRAKASAVIDLAHKSLEGVIPNGATIAAMSDEEIITRLTSVRGIGTWTVEMLLMFRLGRPDILPATDLGVRKGFARLFELGEPPDPNVLMDYGDRWRPYRSMAAWYLWRIHELDKDALPPL